MKIKHVMIILVLAVSVLFLEADMVNNEASAQGDVVVVVNSGAPSLTRTQVRNIFTGRMMRWPGGGSIKVLINKDSGVYAAFCRKYMGMSSASVDNLWVKKSIRDGVATPRKVPGSVIRVMCSRSKAFIGFLSRSKATGVKVID